MEYSEALDEDIAEFEATAMALARGDDAVEERDYVAVLDHLVNTYPISCPTLLEHGAGVRRTYENCRHEHTASKRIDTLHRLFLREICAEYDPAF